MADFFFYFLSIDFAFFLDFFLNASINELEQKLNIKKKSQAVDILFALEFGMVMSMNIWYVCIVYIFGLTENRRKKCRLFLFTVDWHEIMVYGCSKTKMTNIQRKLLQIEQFEGDTRVFHAFTRDWTFNILNVEWCRFIVPVKIFDSVRFSKS